MDTQTLHNIINSSSEDFILVDCRELNEWEQGHIKEAQLIPLSEFENKYTCLEKSKHIIIQCRSGRRSLNACMFLQDQGYEQLSNLEGGILDWIDNGFETVC